MITIAGVFLATSAIRHSLVETLPELSGGMTDIQTNLAMLPENDLHAIAEYLLSLE